MFNTIIYNYSTILTLHSPPYLPMSTITIVPSRLKRHFHQRLFGHLIRNRSSTFVYLSTTYPHFSSDPQVSPVRVSSWPHRSINSSGTDTMGDLCVKSPLAAIFLCYWTSVYPNIAPSPDVFWERFRDKLGLAFLDLLGPEFLLVLLQDNDLLLAGLSRYLISTAMPLWFTESLINEL